MKKLFYAVRDLKANSFVFPHFDLSHGEAIRQFGDTVRNSKSPFYSHPEDYSLYHLGEFDIVSGILTPLKLPCLLASAIEFDNRVLPGISDDLRFNGGKPKEVIHG